MARAWIEDRWLTEDATPAEKRALNAAVDPLKARVRPAHRKTAYGTGRRWVVYWMETTPDGARRRRNRRFERKNDAEAWRTQIEDDIRSGRYVDKESASHTFSEAARLWMGTRTDIRPQSLERYAIDYRRYIAPRWANTPVGDITAIDIDLWIAALTRPDATTGRKALSATTLSMIRLVYAGVLDLAVERRWLAANPAKRAHWPKSRRNRRHSYLTPSQIDKLVAACDALIQGRGRGRSIAGEGTLILFLACTGLRIGEAAALTVGDIDFAARVVHVSKTRNGARGIWTGTGPTKNGHDRDVPLPRILDDRLTRLAEGHALDEPLFRNANGGWLTYAGWKDHRWTPAVQAAGLDGIVPHDLRHTYASMLIGQGLDVKTVQKLLGHSTAALTLDVYADLWPGNDRKAADTVDAMWTVDAADGTASTRSPAAP